METHFESDLAKLKGMLLSMAELAQRAVNDATEAVVSQNRELALRVKANDDVLDRFEVDIDNASVQLLAKAPLASDLRLITVAMKISMNLERVGDEACKIAKRAAELAHENPLPQNREIPPFAAHAIQMLRQAIDAFVRRDARAARALIPEDREIDALHRRVYQELARQMSADPGTIWRALGLMVVAKSLERVADHATNIAEQVVYLCEAQDIRHLNKPPV